MAHKRYTVCIDDGGAWVHEECHKAANLREVKTMITKLRAKRPRWPYIGVYDEVKKRTVALWERTDGKWKQTGYTRSADRLQK